jgi:hypothetical protein
MFSNVGTSPHPHVARGRPGAWVGGCLDLSHARDRGESSPLLNDRRAIRRFASSRGWSVGLMGQDCWTDKEGEGGLIRLDSHDTLTVSGSSRRIGSAVRFAALASVASR